MPGNISALEAPGRLNEFTMSKNSHTVVRLAVHLPNQQQIVYEGGQAIQAIERAARSKHGLNLIKLIPKHINYPYTDILHYYVFVKIEKDGKYNNEEANK